MRGMPNINMALLFAYSDFSLASEKEKSQVKKDIFFILVFYKNCCCVLKYAFVVR